MTDQRGQTRIARRFRRHSRRAQTIIVAFAGLIGLYASWLGGDYGLGPGAAGGYAIVAGVILLSPPTPRGVFARGCYLLAALVAVTPIFLHLPVLTRPQPGLVDPVGRVLQPGVAVMALVFIGIGVALVALAAVIDDRDSPAERNL